MTERRTERRSAARRRADAAGACRLAEAAAPRAMFDAPAREPIVPGRRHSSSPTSWALRPATIVVEHEAFTACATVIPVMSA